MNPDVAIFSVSEKTKEGQNLWFDWLLDRVEQKLLLVANN